MSFDILRLSRKASALAVLGLGAGLLACLQGARGWLWVKALEAERHAESVEEAFEDSEAELEQARSLRSLKRQDLTSFKTGLPGAAQSRKSLYEAGLGLQEEKRLLEKQWEMLSTYLRVEAAERKIHVMRGDQSLESYPLSYEGPTILGQEPRSLPLVSEIVSKERFAHPERGKSETVNGKLEWTPPQVGTSVRANALGEYVLFTRGPLILHGPPAQEEAHRKFPHLCIGLSLRAAEGLFKGTYIGTKVFVKLTGSQKLPSLGMLDTEISTRTARAPAPAKR